jgi:hypothetical protein
MIAAKGPDHGGAEREDTGESCGAGLFGAERVPEQRDRGADHPEGPTLTQSHASDSLNVLIEASEAGSQWSPAGTRIHSDVRQDFGACIPAIYDIMTLPLEGVAHSAC